MSTEDKATEVSAEAQDQESITPPTDPESIEPGQRAGGDVAMA